MGDIDHLRGGTTIPIHRGPARTNVDDNSGLMAVLGGTKDHATMNVMQKSMEDELEKKRKEWEDEVRKLQHDFFSLQMPRKASPSPAAGSGGSDGEQHNGELAVRGAGDDRNGVEEAMTAIPGRDLVNTHGSTNLIQSRNGKRIFNPKFDLSGFNSSEISVRVEGRKLFVEGSHEEDDGHGKQVNKSFSRQVDIPACVDIDQMTSYLSDDGTMSVEAPVEEEAPPAITSHIPPPEYDSITEGGSVDPSAVDHQLYLPYEDARLYIQTPEYYPHHHQQHHRRSVDTSPARYSPRNYSPATRRSYIEHSQQHSPSSRRGFCEHSPSSRRAYCEHSPTTRRGYCEHSPSSRRMYGEHITSTSPARSMFRTITPTSLSGSPSSTSSLMRRNSPTIVMVNETRKLKMQLDVGDEFDAEDVEMSLDSDDSHLKVQASKEEFIGGRTSKKNFSREYELPEPIESSTLRASLDCHGRLHIGASLKSNQDHLQALSSVMADFPKEATPIRIHI